MQGSEAVTAQHDVYAPPRAHVADLAIETASTEFYVVSLRKFWLLLMATFGLYSYYWFYRHWARYRVRNHEPLWPVARAIFSIFFVHSLNRNVDDTLRKARTAHAWWPAASATAFIVLSIVSGICSRLAGRIETLPWLDYVSIALLVPIGWTMASTQRAANAACDDPRGARNARLTKANFAWLVLGGLFWLVYLAGLVLTSSPLAIDVDLPQR
jgi:hypothetical protein